MRKCRKGTQKRVTHKRFKNKPKKAGEKTSKKVTWKTHTHKHTHTNTNTPTIPDKREKKNIKESYNTHTDTYTHTHTQKAIRKNLKLGRKNHHTATGLIQNT